MTRLKEALEKAARAESGGEGTHSGQFSVPPQVVPDAWQFESIEERSRDVETPFDIPLVVEAAAPAGDREVVAPGSDTPAAEPPADSSRAAAQQADFWSSYAFGDRAVGKVVVGKHALPSLVEQYRRLGAALHHHQQQTGARTLMVTSAVAAEGKTLTSTNLALTLSHSYQRRVLLVDADLRRPGLHRLLRVDNSIGLTDCIRQPDRVSARFQTVSPTLSVLTAGRANSDPMAGLVSDTMRALLAQASEQFDWVIIDTPPVALLPDANLLAAMVDSALIVIGAGATPYPLVRRAVDAIGEQRILGIVLNRMAEADIVRAYSYYGYGAYTYGMKRRGSRLLFWKRSTTPPTARAEASAP